MRREDLGDLMAFATIASEGSFTKAAARLGVSGSALSHAIRGLEQRLGVTLLLRTTRSVAPTDAGRRLLETLAPALADIRGGLERLGDEGSHYGPIRISAPRPAAEQLIAPRLPRFQARFPEVQVELVIDDGMVDIIAEGFDAGVRSGEYLARDMVAVRIGSDERSVVVAAPSLLDDRPPPASPDALGDHRCIGYRHLPSKLIHRWQFERGERRFEVTIAPCFIANDVDVLTAAALAGVGYAYVLRSAAAVHLAAGCLTEVLAEWSVPFAGSFLYYPRVRHLSSVMQALVEALRSPALRSSSSGAVSANK